MYFSLLPVCFASLSPPRSAFVLSLRAAISTTQSVRYDTFHSSPFPAAPSQSHPLRHSALVCPMPNLIPLTGYVLGHNHSLCHPLCPGIVQPILPSTSSALARNHFHLPAYALKLNRVRFPHPIDTLRSPSPFLRAQAMMILHSHSRTAALWRFSAFCLAPRARCSSTPAAGVCSQPS